MEAASDSYMLWTQVLVDNVLPVHIYQLLNQLEGDLTNLSICKMRANMFQIIQVMLATGCGHFGHDIDTIRTLVH